MYRLSYEHALWFGLLSVYLFCQCMKCFQSDILRSMMNKLWLSGLRSVVFIIGLFQSTWIFAQDGHSEIAQMVASPIEGGYSWTLASRLGQMISMAEERFGERDKSWTLLGVEFKNDGNPAIWYPYSNHGKRYIIIQLNRQSAKDETKALFQMAHEVIHILSPSVSHRPSNVLEEGLAVYFSLDYLKSQGIEVGSSYVVDPDYKRAYLLVEQLYMTYDDVDSIIQQIRRQKQGFRQLVLADMQHYFPNTDRTILTNLIRKF